MRTNKRTTGRRSPAAGFNFGCLVALVACLAVWALLAWFAYGYFVVHL